MEAVAVALSGIHADRKNDRSEAVGNSPAPSREQDSSGMKPTSVEKLSESNLRRSRREQKI